MEKKSSKKPSLEIKYPEGRGSVWAKIRNALAQRSAPADETRERIAENIRPDSDRPRDGVKTVDAKLADLGMFQSLIKSAQEFEKNGFPDEAYRLYVYAANIKESIEDRGFCIKMIQIYREHKEFDKARMIFERSREILENDFKAIHELYLTFLEEAGGDIGRAEDAFVEFVNQIHLNNPVVDDYFGTLESREERTSEPGETLEDAILRNLPE